MLINQQNAHILPLVDKLIKRLLNRHGLCFAVDYEEVLACLWWRCDVLLFFFFVLGRGIYICYVGF